MRILRSFLRLSWEERRALVVATTLVSIVRVALHVLPFETLRRTLARLARTPSGVRPGELIVVGQLGPDLARYAPFPAMRGLEP